MHKMVKRSLAIPILVACSVLVSQRASAADMGAVIPPSGQVATGTAVLITPEMMAANEQALAASNMNQPAVVAVPFRSTVPGYEAAKAAIDGAVAMSSKADAPSYDGPLAPLTKMMSFEGVSKWTAGGWYPPDTEGAVGNNHFVEVTNSHIDIYSKATHALLKSISLNAFFGRTAAGQTAMFDPRCIYDRVWDRFVVMAPDFTDGAGNMRINLAISKTADPLGGWWRYCWNIGTDAEFFDYPQLGMDWDGLIITANIFNTIVGSEAYLGAKVFSLAKTSMYNGWGQTYWQWGGLYGTLAPPIVLDNNPSAFLVAAPGGNGQTTVWKYTLQSAGRAPAFLYGPTAITVPTYSMPPSAPQPGTTAALDTMDARFVNVSTQVGNSLFQIHTVSFGTANAKLYEFDTAGNTLLHYQWYYSTGTSSDWNASIAANDAGDVFVTWNSTDTANKVQVRVGGRRAADAGVNQYVLTDHGFSVFESPVNYGAAGYVNRWGDYSAVSLDPLNGNFAWFVNEKNNGANAWGTRIGRMGF